MENLSEIDFQDLNPNNPQDRKELATRLKKELEIITKNTGKSSTSYCMRLVDVLIND